MELEAYGQTSIGRRLALVASLFLCLTACRPEAEEPILPTRPEGLTPADATSFPSSVSMAHLRAVGFANEHLQAYGPLRHEARKWPASADRADLIATWDADLAKQGFRRMDTGLSDLPDYLAPGAWMAVWTRGRDLVALVGQLPTEDAGGWIPVTILLSTG